MKGELPTETNEVESDSEEEIILYAEFANNINIEKYNSVHILGINEKKPIVQMNDTFFVGTYENPLGTYMFFEDDLNPQSTDPVFDRLPEKNVKYVCKTRKFLKLEHGYITPKDGAGIMLNLSTKCAPMYLKTLVNGPSSQNLAQETQEDIKPINFKTLQEALDKFKKEWSISDSTTPMETDK